MKALGPWIAGGLLLAALGARDAGANPIRANTPGTGVFQRSGLVAGVVVDRKAGGGAELLSLSSFAEVLYTPDTHWILSVRVPYIVESRLDLPGRPAETVSGPGDVVVSVKHRFYRWVGPWADRHAAVEIGLKLPTGATDRPVDPAVPVSLRNRLQPGTGSADGLIDVVYQQARRRWVFAADAGYRFNSEGDGGYRRGDEARLNASVQYVAFPRVYTQPGHEVFAVLEGTLVDTEEDRLRGASLPGTDRSALLLAPGVQYVATERLFLDFSLQVPVWEEVGRGELESRWNALVQLRYAF
jgi:Putative MetA-pathway of phenol degradation